MPWVSGWWFGESWAGPGRTSRFLGRWPRMRMEGSVVHSFWKSCSTEEVNPPRIPGATVTRVPAAAGALGQCLAACQPRTQSVLVGGFQGFPQLASCHLCPAGPAKAGVFPGASPDRAVMACCSVLSQAGPSHLSARAWRCTRPPQPWTASGSTSWT